jgi:hypothetical protein
MRDRRDRVLDVKSNEVHHTYKSKWERDWWFLLPPSVQYCLVFLWDYADYSGFVNPERINDFNYKIFRYDVDKHLKQDYVLEQANQHKNLIRVAPDGYWLFEDYFRVQTRRISLDCSKGIDRKQGAGNEVKGFVRPFVEHSVNPETIRGLQRIKLPDEELLDVGEYGYNRALYDLVVADKKHNEADYLQAINKEC